VDSGIIWGIWQAMSPQNLLWGTIGCILGTIVGILPGLGPTSAIAILFPLTMSLPAAPAIIMLGGIYYGAMYGGSTTSILMNIPGEASSVPTTFDGYEMAKQGRAGPALAISAIGSFIGATFAITALAFIGPYLADLAFYFTAPDYAGMMFFSLVSLATLSGKSVLKGILVVVTGMLLATVGCSLGGVPCFTYGNVSLMAGIGLIPMIIGLFGISEILIGLEEEIVTIAQVKLGKLMPTVQELRDCFGCTLRASVIGFSLGLLPGMIPTIASFMAYDVEKRISKNRSNFGKGAIEGVCAPETANNANAQAGYIPLMAFGIPPTPTLALLLSALMVFGLQPGPMLFTKNQDFVWTIIGGMYVGNVILVILNLPLVGMWARIVYIPYKILAPIILGICFIGAYAIRDEMFDVWIAIVFGVVGYIAKKTDWPIPPLILGFILGPMFEGSLRPSLTKSEGSILIFFTQPISLGFIVLTFMLIGLKIYLTKSSSDQMDVGLRN
jgi:putative tricarboxylic transport membrane protein